MECLYSHFHPGKTWNVFGWTFCLSYQLDLFFSIQVLLVGSSVTLPIGSLSLLPHVKPACSYRLFLLNAHWLVLSYSNQSSVTQMGGFQNGSLTESLHIVSKLDLWSTNCMTSTTVMDLKTLYRWEESKVRRALRLQSVLKWISQDYWLYECLFTWIYIYIFLVSVTLNLINPLTLCNI